MTHSEIRDTYAELSPCEAFEAFDAAMVDNATVAELLGQEVASEYSHWIYANLK